MDIRLPDTFSPAHRAMVLRFVQGHPLDNDQRVMQIQAFDLLHQALVGDATFAAFYARVVEESAADAFITALIDSADPEAAAPALRQRVNRQIPLWLRQAGCEQPYGSPEFYLLAYCLYWWYAFTTGYAFEIAILRDLRASGVDFQAHDLRDRHARQSPFDLVVLGFTGDLKTSTYFLHTLRTRGLLADFYITRLYDPRSRQRRLVVFLKRPAWEAIDGEAQPTTLADLPTVMPTVAEMTHDRQPLIVVDYPEWKARVLRRQRGEQE